MSLVQSENRKRPENHRSSEDDLQRPCLSVCPSVSWPLDDRGAAAQSNNQNHFSELRHTNTENHQL